MKAKELAEAKIKQIYEFCGYKMQLEENFTKFKRHRGCKYFSVTIQDSLLYNSPVWSVLQRLKDVGIIENAEENGVNRLAIFIK